MGDNRLMIVAFLESIKYVGHFFSVALLRIFLGYCFLESAVQKFNGDFLARPILSSAISEWLPTSPLPDWYKQLLLNFVVPSPNWKFFAYTLTYCEFVIGLGLVIGFLVRPLCLLGILLCINFIYLTSGTQMELYRIYLVLFTVMCWAGAGRCLGFDYFFFKRKRGIWW